MAHRYVGNKREPSGQPPRKRKGSPNNYKVPQKDKQRQLDRQYLEFQREPKLSQLSKDLRIKPKCDTILGGKRIWLRKERPVTREQFKFPIIVDGTRCPNDATSTFRDDGKNIRRCSEHSRDDYWIDTDNDE